MRRGSFCTDAGLCRPGAPPGGVGTYERCRAALEELGLRTSPALEEVRRATVEPAPPVPAPAPARPPPTPPKEERRLVSVLFAELSGPVGIGQRLDPEDLREVVGGALARVIAEVEGLGGTVTSVSGAGLVALFGAPEAHEDDPERAVRAAFRLSVSATAAIGAGSRTSVASASRPGRRWSAPSGAGRVTTGRWERWWAWPPCSRRPGRARSWSARSLVPPPRAFRVGADRRVAPHRRPSPCRLLPGAAQGTAPGYRGHRRWAGAAPLVGRRVELAVLDQVFREATRGPGLCRVPGGRGRARQDPPGRTNAASASWPGWGPAPAGCPLWLEGRAASYASSTPYGLYQQLLSAWVGVAPEEGEEALRPALERA